MLMFWDALREVARRRQDKKSKIPSRNDCFSAKKKQKRNFIQKTKQEYLQKKKKKNILKMSERFLSKFCYCSEIWHSIFEFISASDILHLFFLFFCVGEFFAESIQRCLFEVCKYFARVGVHFFTQHFNHPIIGFFLFYSVAVHKQKEEQNRSTLHGLCKFDERFLATI